MRKGVSFVSAILTTFILALVGGVVYAYSGITSKNADLQSVAQANSQSTSSAQSMSLPVAVPTGTPVPNVSPQDAAYQASQYLNNTDLYSIELADYNGAQSYKVTFSSGDVVYVDLQGQILGTEPPPTPQVITISSGGGGGGANKNSHHSGDGEHEGGGHEGHDD